MGYKTDTESCTGNLLKVFYSFNFIVSHVARLKTRIECFLNRFNAYF